MSPLRLLGPGWSHAVCTTIAVVVALYVAYFLQLENPASAATTVLVVASPIHGMVLAKSVYRFLGTLLGAAASVALIALFAQTPELFILGTSLWVGFFTAVSSLMRRFRAYGAVLAGYTITLVAFGAVDNPLNIFDLAMARIAVVTVGIICSAVVTILLAPNAATHDFPRKLRGAVQNVVGVIKLALTGSSEDVFGRRRYAAGLSVQALDNALYGASAESAAVAARSGYARRANAALMGLLAAATSLRQSIDQLDERAIEKLQQPLERLTILLGQLHEAGERVGDLAVDERWMAEIAEIRTLCAAAQPDPASANQDGAMPLLIAINRLDDLLEHGCVLVQSLRSFADQGAKPIDIRQPHHRDVATALINGLRGIILTWLLGAFWIYTAWPSGAQLFAAAVPICCLVAASERQQADSIAFCLGVALAAIAGFFCTFGLLTQIGGFPLLAAALAPFILGGAYLSTKPRFAGGATGFLIFFVTFVSPHNPMTFDMATYLNTTFANVFGMACVLPCFRVIFPQNHWRSTVKLARDIGLSLAKLAASPKAGNLLQWEYRAHDRLAVMATRLSFDNPRRAGLVNGALAAIRIGREIVRARSLLEKIPLDHGTRATVTTAFRAFSHAASQPQRAIDQAMTTAQTLLQQARTMPEDGARAVLRATASLQECSALLEQNQAFFTAPQGRPMVIS